MKYDINRLDLEDLPYTGKVLIKQEIAFINDSNDKSFKDSKDLLQYMTDICSDLLEEEALTYYDFFMIIRCIARYNIASVPVIE